MKSKEATLGKISTSAVKNYKASTKQISICILTLAFLWFIY